jgi:ABC-2 type transport system ATP-binding protein
MPAISFQSVSKTYSSAKGPFKALDGVSFDIEEGEFFGLLGPNGAGKTTLISILAGLARATAGACGDGPRRAGRLCRAPQLGVVPQELVFDPFFSVREALRIQSGYFGVRTTTPGSTSCWPSLGLADKAGANMRQLSGGMKRRVLVAQALVHKPPVIVLDEPTAGVDVELRQTLWQFIARLNREGPHRAADHPLPGRGRGPVRAHRHAQAGARGGAGAHQRAAQGGFQQRAALQDRRRAAAGAGRQARVTGRIVQLPAHDAARSSSTWPPCARPACRCRGHGDPQGRSGGCVPGCHGGQRRRCQCGKGHE